MPDPLVGTSPFGLAGRDPSIDDSSFFPDEDAPRFGFVGAVAVEPLESAAPRPAAGFDPGGSPSPLPDVLPRTSAARWSGFEPLPSIEPYDVGSVNLFAPIGPTSSHEPVPVDATNVPASEPDASPVPSSRPAPPERAPIEGGASPSGGVPRHETWEPGDVPPPPRAFPPDASRFDEGADRPSPERGIGPGGRPAPPGSSPPSDVAPSGGL